MPSAAELARDFSLLAQVEQPVSREAVRKWMLGQCFPDFANIAILVAWLDIDLGQIFELGNADAKSVGAENSSAVDGVGLELLGLLSCLPESQKRALVGLAREMRNH